LNLLNIKLICVEVRIELLFLLIFSALEKSASIDTKVAQYKGLAHSTSDFILDIY